MGAIIRYLYILANLKQNVTKHKTFFKFAIIKLCKNFIEVLILKRVSLSDLMADAFCVCLFLCIKYVLKENNYVHAQRNKIF